MIMIETNAIAKEDITTDVLFKIAQEILKDCTQERAKEVEETVYSSPSIELMKEDLEVYKKIVHTLVEKIKEEEGRRKKDTHHLIEKKIRTTTISDEIVAATNPKGFTSSSKLITDKEVFKYRREGNKVVCIIDTPVGKFYGTAIQHEDDKFNYEAGMTLAMLRARKQQYETMERDFAKSL